MARKSKSDRINEILRLNPALSRTDPRIEELILAEGLQRKAQRAAKRADITVTTRTGGVKRAPELIAVDAATTAVRRLRNDLGIDRVNVKRNEDAGIKVKRSPEAEKYIALYGPEYHINRDLLPGLAAFLHVAGIVPEDMPEEHRAAYESDLAAQTHLNTGMAERVKA